MRRTWLGRAVRSWVWSTLAFVLLLAAGVAAIHLARGEVERIPRNVLDISLAFGVIFGLAAAAVHVPLFALFARRSLQSRSAMLGAALGTAPFLMVIAAFSDQEDPQTIAGWLTFWATHLPEFVAGLLPFAAAGAVFGAVWSSSGPEATERVPMT